MPASYVLLAAFNADISGTVAGGTARSWMAAVRSWHVFHHAPWHGGDEWVKLTRSCTSKEGVEFEKPPRAPVSMEHLVVLRDALDISQPFDAAVWAIALVTFFACRRLGETVVTDPTKFSPRYHVTRAQTVSFRTLRNGTKSASFNIPWTKTTKEKGASVTFTERPDGLAGVTGICPIAALHNHLEVNDDASIPPSASLFAYRQGRAWKHMGKEVFLKYVYRIWKKAKLQYVSGHSFRIGGAVELLLRGVPPEVVAATGGWTSLAFLLYWRKVEEVLPLSTSKAYKKACVEELAESLETFRISEGLPSYLAAKDLNSDVL
ncbi:hypothetical protein NMY22_g17166 [Coprinellus aureogranulatus]|nr:hypothetical protein NMY22_g17166 [Coprinellus aureogranulatus]